ALNADVEIDDAVVIHVDLAVIVEIAVRPAGYAQAHVEVNLAIVVDVDLAVEIGIPAVGVHDQCVGPSDGLSAPDGRVAGVGEVLHLLRGGDADAGEVSAGRVALRGDDSAAVPERQRVAVSAGLN